MYRNILFFLCVVLSSLDHSQSADNRERKNVSSLAENQTYAIAEKIWVSQLFDLARQRFDMTTNQSVQCKRDYDLYQLHSRNQSIWAVRSKFSDCIYTKKRDTHEENHGFLWFVGRNQKADLEKNILLQKKTVKILKFTKYRK